MVEEAEHDTPREVVERRKPVATARPRDRRDTEARRHATDFATAAAGARNKLSPGGKKVEQKKVEPCCLKETITPREVVETRKPVATARLRDRRDIEAWRHAAEIATSAAGARNKVSPGGKKVEPCCMEDFFFCVARSLEDPAKRAHFRVTLRGGGARPREFAHDENAR